MKSKYRWLIGLAFLLWACGKGGEKAPEYDVAGEFSKLQASYNEVTKLREELASIDEKINLLKDAKKAPKKYKKEELPQEDLETLQTQKDEVQKTLDQTYDAFMDNLTLFLNKGLNEFPDKPETKKAIRMYSDENIRVAQEYIDRAGDYPKALDILKEAIKIDPDYPKLQEALRHVHEWQYITRERFDKVKKGMSMKQVKEICGNPNIKYIKEEKKASGKITAWFYPKEDKTATGIYFLNGRVYQKQWEIKTKK